MKNLLLCFFAVLLSISLLPIAASKTVAADPVPMMTVSLDGNITEMTVEDYTLMALLGEGAECESRQSKLSLAVAIRSCAIYATNFGLKHKEFAFCDDSGCCFALVDPKDAQSDALTECTAAASETFGQILTHDSEPALALFTLCAGSGTRDNRDFPYLTAVTESEKCDLHKFETSVEMSSVAYFAVINETGEEDNIKNNSCLVYGTNEKCEFGVFGGKMVSGEELAALLGLPSTEFELFFRNENAEAVSYGVGNGYGLNLCGAERMAKENFGFAEILEFYYPELKLKKIYA